MNKTDRVTVQYADAYYQSAIKWIDGFLMKWKSTSETPGEGGARAFTAAEGRDDLERVIGALNTIAMKIEDRVGIITNWDQGSPTLAAARIKSYVPENEDSSGVLKGVNVNDKMA